MTVISTKSLTTPKSQLRVRAFEGSGHTDRFGCPCCAPVLQKLGQMSLPYMAAAANPKAWHKLGPPALPQTGTFVLTNAKILTVDDQFSSAEAMAVRDGRIVAIGSKSDVMAQAGAEAQLLDGGGKTILPGFIEPHMHFFPIAILGRYPDVGANHCADADAVIAKLAELAAAVPPGGWLLARQFDPALQPGADRITRQALDQAASNIPVFLFNSSLHIAYCNSRALEIASITSQTPDPPGSAFGRDSDGLPNGVLMGQGAIFAVLAHCLGAMALDDVPEACVRVSMKASQVGVTTICDQASGGFQGRREMDAFHAFAASGHMTARLRYSLAQTGADNWDRHGLTPGEGDAMVRAIGWKIVSDGSNQGRTGLQRQPYLGGGSGIAYVEPDALIEIVTKRAVQGWQVVVHANGDLAIDRALDAFEAAYAAGAPRDIRFRIEHCSVLHDEQIERIASLRVSPSFLIGHVHYWGKAFRDEIFGPEKADLLCRAASCGQAGIRWTMHSDDTVTEMGPLRLIDNAVNRILWAEPGGVLNPAERVSVPQAIVALTRDAAWQCHSDHEIGTLEVGKFADFVVLDQDPTEVPTTELGAIRVLETWVGGRRVWASN